MTTLTPTQRDILRLMTVDTLTVGANSGQYYLSSIAVSQRTVQRLLDAGLIAGVADTRSYALTEAGRAALAQE